MTIALIVMFVVIEMLCVLYGMFNSSSPRMNGPMPWRTMVGVAIIGVFVVWASALVFGGVR